MKYCSLVNVLIFLLLLEGIIILSQNWHLVIHNLTNINHNNNNKYGYDVMNVLNHSAHEWFHRSQVISSFTSNIKLNYNNNNNNHYNYIDENKGGSNNNNSNNNYYNDENKGGNANAKDGIRVAMFMVVMDSVLPHWLELSLDLLSRQSHQRRRNHKSTHIEYDFILIAPYLSYLPSLPHVYVLSVPIHQLLVSILANTIEDVPNPLIDYQHIRFMSSGENDIDSSIDGLINRFNNNLSNSKRPSFVFPDIELFNHSTTSIKLLSIFEHVVTSHPHAMQEFLPLFGFMFQELLSQERGHGGYSYQYWGYFDPTQIIGDIHDIKIAIDGDGKAPSYFDVITLTAGDNYRIYLRNQFTMQANQLYLNTLYKTCMHYHHLVSRLQEYSLSSYRMEWVMLSPEWCYSKAIVEHKQELNIMLASKLLDTNNLESDRYSSTMTKKARDKAIVHDDDVLWINGDVIQCSNQAIGLEAWFQSQLEINSSTYSGLTLNQERVQDTRRRLRSSSHKKSNLHKVRGRDLPSQRSKSASNYVMHRGSIEDIDVHKNRNASSVLGRADLKQYSCSPWIPKPFQTCLDSMNPDADVEIMHGIIQFRESEKLQACQKYVSFDISRWIRSTYAFTMRAVSVESKIVAFSSVGTIPLIVDGIFRDADTGHPSDYVLDSWANQRKLTPGIVKSRAVAKKITSMSYCGAFVGDVTNCACPLFSNEIIIAHVADNYGLDNSVVTFITVAWADDFYAGALDDSLNAWGPGQKIVVVARLEAAKTHPVLTRHDCTVIEVSLASCAHLYRSFMAPAADASGKVLTSLPDNILYNIGLDVAATEIVCVVPPGITLDLPSNFQSSEIAQALMDGKDPKVIIFPCFVPWNSLRDVDKMYFKQQRARELVQELQEEIDHEETQTSSHRKVKNKNHDRKHRSLFHHHDNSVEQSTNSRRLTSNSNPSTLKLSDEYIAIPYPVHSSHAPHDQPSTLVLEFPHNFNPLSNRVADALALRMQRTNPKISSYISTGQHKISLKMLDLLKERTFMLPFLFNVSANRHSRDFVRFPEEMSGVGCYGSSILRVLVGSGYTPFWSSNSFGFELNPRLHSNLYSTPAMVKADHKKHLDLTSSTNEACVFGDTPNVLRQMSARINSYYIRAVELRKHGLATIYNRFDSKKSLALEFSARIKGNL